MIWQTKFLSCWLLLFCFAPLPTQAAAADSGPESGVLLCETGEGDAGAWFERALNEDRPAKLTIHASSSASLWQAEVYSDDYIRSYLKALKEVKVAEIPLADGLWDDAPGVRYAFHMPDGSVKTFVFQEGRVCVYPQSNGNDRVYPVIGRGGMDFLLGVYGVQPLH